MKKQVIEVVKRRASLPYKCYLYPSPHCFNSLLIETKDKRVGKAPFEVKDRLKLLQGAEDKCFEN